MGGEILEHSQANEDLATEIKSDEEQKPVDRLGLILSTASARRHYDPHSLAPPIPHFPAPATASMATTVPEPPRPKIAAQIDHRFLMYQFKVVSCTSDDCKGGDKCPFLHPGEKGRRNPRRFFYCSTSCIHYRRNGDLCPAGDGCHFAHGFLETLFHPSSPWYTGALKSWELKRLIDMGKWLHPHERDAIDFILDLKSNGQICGYEYGHQVPHGMLLEKGFDRMTEGGFSPLTDYNVPCDAHLVAATEQASSFYDGIGNQVAAARVVSKAIFEHYGFKTIIGGTYPSRNTFTLKLFPQGVVAATAAAKRVGLMAPLLCAAASPTAGWIDKPELVAFLDSAASVHVVGEDTELQGYQALAEAWSIAVADGYSLDVLGVGYIETRRGSFSVPKVFKVRGLEMNLISVGQLDRDHGLFSGFHDGTCKVLKRDGDHIGGGFLQANNLYALTFLQVPEN